MRNSDSLPQIRHRLNPGDDRIALYVRLTGVLRSRIATGDWKVGQRIPSIEALCEEYGVARNTVRQALEILSDEGLIRGGRGVGTFVLQTPALSAIDNDLKNAISDPLTLGPDQSIEILKRVKKVPLPEQLVRDLPVYAEYTLVRKLHRFRNQPFALMDIYVASPIYERFPKGQDTAIKIARLLRDSGVAIEKSQLEITTRPADPETAQLLNYSMAGSLVCMRRWRTDNDGRVVTAGTYLYRGDLFVLDIEEPSQGTTPALPSIAARARPR